MNIRDLGKYEEEESTTDEPTRKVRRDEIDIDEGEGRFTPMLASESEVHRQGRWSSLTTPISRA